MKTSSNSLLTSKGTPHPFGATVQEGGMNFSIYSKKAEAVTLCFFEAPYKPPVYEIELTEKTGDIWHVFIHDAPKHLFYAYRIDAQNGESPFLLDPFAKCVSTSTEWANHSHEETPYRPIGVVLPENDFDWENTSSPKIPIKDLVVYEMHVRGFTQSRSSGVEHKGKFLGIVEKIPYLKELGINAVKLLPIHEFNENENGRINPITFQKLYQYWGYSTVNYFSPMNRYVVSKERGAAVKEFKTLVRELHKNGIEVILDVVFNHTAEGNQKGPTYSFKGIDKEVYYILNHEEDFWDFTGCGNTFNCNHPVVIEFIQSCLRYWVTEMHVDGFRFDLASIFYRGIHGDPIQNPPLVQVLSYDPILAETKLIAEPWDAAGMYQVGNYFPDSCRWSEWNGKYRDATRRFIKGIPGEKREFASKICGSEDLYSTRSPCCSINFLTAHDGFTLADLVSYNNKHNIENGEEDRDGLSCNDSWNCGAEGPTADQQILTIREKQKRNLILALMISQGIPMIKMGDEYGHSKKGNNNTWCQDNELNWFIWEALQNNKGFFRFFVNTIKLRNQHEIFRQGKFLTDEDIDWHGVSAFNPDWDGMTQFLAFTLKAPQKNQAFYIAFNVKDHEVKAEIPPPPKEKNWHLIINTASPSPLDFIEEEKSEPIKQKELTLQEHSSIVLKSL